MLNRAKSLLLAANLVSAACFLSACVCFLICPGAVIFLSNHNVASQKINKTG